MKACALVISGVRSIQQEVSMGNDNEQSRSHESKMTLQQEFNAALEQAKVMHEPGPLDFFEKRRLRHRGSLLGTVQFGSMVNGNPRFDENGVLLSDIDLMFIYSGTKVAYKESDPRGLTKQDNGPFSEHIPNADILLHNVRDILDKLAEDKSEILRELQVLENALEPNSHTRSLFWSTPDNRELIRTFPNRFTRHTIMYQIIQQGELVLEPGVKELPPEISQAAEEVHQTLRYAAQKLREWEDALPSRNPNKK